MNIFFCNFAGSVALSLGLSALGDFVRHVDGWGSEEQVDRIDAQRSVASVKNLKTVRYRLYEKFVGDVRRFNDMPSLLAGTDDTVSLPVVASSPEDAPAGFLTTDIAEESVDDWGSAGLMVAGRGAKAPDYAGFNRKRRAAIFTDSDSLATVDCLVTSNGAEFAVPFFDFAEFSQKTVVANGADAVNLRRLSTRHDRSLSEWRVQGRLTVPSC